MGEGGEGEGIGKDKSYLENAGGRSGIAAWMLSTDHKRIGVMYLAALMSFFGVGVVLGLVLRLNMLHPGAIMNAQQYNETFSLHGVIMLFLVIIPGIPAAFGNFFLPIMLGARDVAFPRLNRLTWWIYLTGAAIVLASIFLNNVNPPDTGWTFYVPYSIRSQTNVSLAALGVFVLGFTSILTGLNFVTTIHTMRARGMTWFRLPLFAWTLYATGWVQMLATPVLAITLLLVVLGRNFGIGLFNPARGGDPIMYEHSFWTYSHPAVYIMVLPAMGIISEVIPVFARKAIFGYKFIVFAALAIAGVGYAVWGHHMFVSGMSDNARVVFSFLTFLVAVPTGVKVFNWVATLYKGSIRMDVPLYWAVTFIFLFSIGGLSGLIMGALAPNIDVHGTYFIAAHIHYVVFGSVGPAIFAGLHYWFPKMFGKMYNQRRAKLGWLIFFIGFNVLYFPMFILGLKGMPRRWFDYPPRFHTGQVIATVGSWILAAGLIIIFGNLIGALFKGEKAPADPWGGRTLEWQTSSPPPAENFSGALPVMEEAGYGAEEA